MKTIVQSWPLFVSLTDIPVKQCFIRFSLLIYIYRQIYGQAKTRLNVLFKQIKKVCLMGLVLNEEIPNPILRFSVRRPFNWWCLAALDTVSQLILLRISNFPHFCQWRPNGRRGKVWIRRISAISHSAQYSTVQHSAVQWSDRSQLTALVTSQQSITSTSDRSRLYFIPGRQIGPRTSQALAPTTAIRIKGQNQDW